jgi:chorismate lyase/3-hydroxybenzoate synthase
MGGPAGRSPPDLVRVTLRSGETTLGPLTGIDSTPQSQAVLPLRPEPPRWVAELLPSASRLVTKYWPLEVRESGSAVRLTARVPRARSLQPGVLAASVRDAYVSIDRHLADLGRYPIRFWNFVPGIGDRVGELDRYMVFNQGRYEALSQSPRLTGTGWSLSTSSAVGIATRDLVIDCLGSDAPGIPIENPRQVSSWRYSPCYGPRPPCFARATIARLDSRPWLLIGGTASIVGESSLHLGEVEAQVAETVANLGALISSACDTENDGLKLLHDARVYVAHSEHSARVRSALDGHLNSDLRLDVALAAICRRELLVEVEGRVLMDEATARGPRA